MTNGMIKHIPQLKLRIQWIKWYLRLIN